jgi:hypothetical protein
VVVPLPTSVHESVVVPFRLIVVAVMLSVGVDGAPVQSLTVTAEVLVRSALIPQSFVAVTLIVPEA